MEKSLMDIFVIIFLNFDKYYVNKTIRKWVLFVRNKSSQSWEKVMESHGFLFY